jgi:hypothetical protein
MSTNRVSSGSFTASSPAPSSSSLRLSANVISSIHSQSETTEAEIAVSSDEGKEKNIKEEIHVEMKQDVRELLGRKFWEEANPLEIVCEVLFHIKRRGTTIEKEVYCGLIQFISCLYILPVLPHQMENAGYDLRTTYVVTVLSPCCSFDDLLEGTHVLIRKYCRRFLSQLTPHYCPTHIYFNLSLFVSPRKRLACTCRRFCRGSLWCALDFSRLETTICIPQSSKEHLSSSLLTALQLHLISSPSSVNPAPHSSRNRCG